MPCIWDNKQRKHIYFWQTYYIIADSLIHDNTCCDYASNIIYIHIHNLNWSLFPNDNVYLSMKTKIYENIQKLFHVLYLEVQQTLLSLVSDWLRNNTSARNVPWCLEKTWTLVLIKTSCFSQQHWSEKHEKKPLFSLQPNTE